MTDRTYIPLGFRHNLNGNSYESLMTNCANLRRALTAVGDALNDVTGENCHGRNYQTVENADRERERDVALLLSFRSQMQMLDDLMLDTQIVLLGDHDR